MLIIYICIDHNQITSLKSENKIGITQMDLHATIQMCNRYSNSKAVLVITKDEEIHREWIQEKFYVYIYTKDNEKNLLSEESPTTKSDINFIKEILNNVRVILYFYYNIHSTMNIILNLL